jgi:hypothetical protein
MKRLLRIALLLGGVAVLLGALSLQTGDAYAAPASRQGSQQQVNAAACGAWKVVPSPNGNGSSGLNTLAVVSAHAIWAVGNVSNPVTHVRTTLIEFWNGSRWSIVSNPNPSSTYNNFYSIAAVSPKDVWAVGFYANAVGTAQTLIEHWNGMQWRVVPSPNVANDNNELLSVAAASSKAVWAVGFKFDSNGNQSALIERWDGAHWRIVPSPSLNANETLSGVAALAANDAWAVGTSNLNTQTLIEHWNGSRWNVVKSNDGGGELRGVKAASSNDVWVVGDAPTGAGGASQTLIEHWNGTRWQVIPSPQVTTPALLSGVVAVSAKDVWVVGSEGGPNVFFQTLIEHWNGSGWAVVPSPSPGSFSTQLAGVAAVSAKDDWAVGYADGTTLIEHDQC